VQNWNDGKAQEYKDRKVYNAHNAIHREFGEVGCCSCTPVMVQAPAAAAAEAPVISADKLTLFTTTTCPNCRIAKTFLDKAGIEYDVVVADQDVETARKYDIRQAPTLVIQRGNDVEKLTNLSEIRRYVDSL
jgi:ribonucleoside-triphosphate reductase